MLRQNNDTALFWRRYGTSGGPWPTCGAPLARAGLEPGPGETRCDPVRSVVRIGARTRSPLCSGDSGTPGNQRALRAFCVRTSCSCSRQWSEVCGCRLPTRSSEVCSRPRQPWPTALCPGRPTPLRGCGPRPGFGTSSYPFPHPFVTEKAFSSYQYPYMRPTYLATHPSENSSSNTWRLKDQDQLKLR